MSGPEGLETPPRTSEAQPSPASPKLPSLWWGWTAVVPIGIFFVYFLTLAPTVVGGDSGELTTAAYKLGVAHPPGYPLFTILAKLFTLIPFGSVAWRVNLFSSVCDTAAAFFIMLTVRQWTRNHLAGVLAAGLFAFSPLIWHYAVVAEVFPLNNLLVASMLYLAVRFAESHDRKLAFITALVFGLGMSNHLTCAFFGFPIMAWMIVASRSRLFNVRSLLILAGCFLVGLTPYLYLPLADLRVTAVSWGHTSTLNGFLNHVLRTEYGGALHLGTNKVATGGYFFLGLFEYLKSMPADVFYIGLALGLTGLYLEISRKGFASLVMVTVLGYCLDLTVFNGLANLPIDNPLYQQVQARFWQQANLMIFVWAGLGFGSLGALLPKKLQRGVPIAIVPIAIVVAIIFGEAAMGFKAADQHRNTLVRDFAREWLRPLPPHSVFWSREDLVTFTTRYVQQCEGYRTDVALVDRDLLRMPWMKRLVNANYPNLIIPGNFYGERDAAGYDARRLFDANSSQSNMFVNRWIVNLNIDWSWNSDYRMLPYGMADWVRPKQRFLDPYAYIGDSANALPQLDAALLATYASGSWENEILKYYWEARLNRSDRLLNDGIGRDDDRYLLEAAAAGFDDLAERAHVRDPSVFKRLGLAYSKLIVHDPKYRPKMQQAWRRYLELGALPEDPDLMEIQQAIKN